MEYVWWGEVVAGAQGARLLGLGPSGTLDIPTALRGQPGAEVPGECGPVTAGALHADLLNLAVATQPRE